MAYIPKEYQLDSGTIGNLGLDYEVAIAAFLSLQCLERDGNMWLASNPKDVDGFDDIVLYRQLPNGTGVTYLVQLKHKEKGTDIKLNEFFKKPDNPKAGPFYLVKYLEHYVALVDRMNSSSDQSEMMKHLREVENFKLVLFTNRGVDKCDFLESFAEDQAEFLSTSKKGVAYTFCYDKIVANSVVKANVDFERHKAHGRIFFENLILFTCQIHMNDGHRFLTDKLKRLLGCTELSHSDFQQVTKRYTEFLQSWAQGDLGGNYPLVKTHIVSNLLSIFCESFMVKFEVPTSYSCNVEFDVQTWDELIATTDITIVNADDVTYSFLGTYIAYKIRQKLSDGQMDNLESWDKGKVVMHPEILNENICKYVHKNRTTTLWDVYKFLWIENHLPLILEINFPQDYENLLNALKLSNTTLRLDILNKTTKALPIKTKIIKSFVAFKDLAEENKQKLAKKAVKVQERPSYTLEKLVDDTMAQIMTSNDIIRILCGKFNIGDVPKPLPSYYVERTMNKVYLDPEVLKNTQELFLVEKEPEGELTMAESEKRNVIIVEPHTYLEHHAKVKSFNRVIHYLHHHGGKLEWKKSFGSIKTIRKYRSEVTDFNSTSINDLHGTTILSGGPGWGKSTFMDYLASCAPGSMWVIRIDLKCFTKYYRSAKCKSRNTLAATHLHFFNEEILAKHGCDIKLAKSIFLKYLNKKKVLVLMDGFDEVSYSHANEVVNIAKTLQEEEFPVWITTRPHMTAFLEEQLDTLSISFQPLNKDEQCQFLIDYFTSMSSIDHYDASKFAKKLLELTKDNLHDENGRFTSIPLQIEFLAELFQEQNKTATVNLHEDFDIVCFYESVAKKKMRILCTKFGESAQEDYYMFEQHLSFFALKNVFPFPIFQSICDDVYKSSYKDDPRHVQLLQKGGIVTVENEFDIHFIHCTCAEYLSAKWLLENIDQENPTLRKAAHDTLWQRFNHDYSFIFHVFDCIATQNNPIHLAIVKGQLNTALKMINSYPELINSLDQVNRSLLHVIAIHKYKYCSSISQHFIQLNAKSCSLENLAERILDSKEISIKECDNLGYNALDYSLANGCLHLAEQICARSNKITIGIHMSSINLKNKYFMYCGMMGYGNLFKCLLRYFAYHDLLQNQEHTNQNVRAYVRECYKLIACHGGLIQRNLESYLNDFGVTELLQLFSSSDLHVASAFGSKENVDLLMHKGADVNKQDAYLNTPLHYSASFGKSEVVLTLISKGAKVNIQNCDEDTPMHIAISNKHVHVVAILLENNADVNIENKDDETALQLAMNNEEPELNALFEKQLLEDDTREHRDSVSNVWKRIVVDDAVIDNLIGYLNSSLREGSEDGSNAAPCRSAFGEDQQMSKITTNGAHSSTQSCDDNGEGRQFERQGSYLL